MKNKRLLSIFLSATIFSLCLTGCSDKREIPLGSTAESAVSSNADTSSNTVSSSESGGASSGQSSSSVPTSSSSESTSSSAVSSSESGGTSSGQSSSSVPTSSSSESTSEAHKHTYTSKTVAPTCVEPGYTVHTCACGDQYTTDTVEALGHDYTQTVVKPTCTANGYTQFVCNRCGQKHNDNITNATGHKYSSQKVDADCEHGGYMLHTCSICGKQYRDAQTNATGHSWSSWATVREATVSSAGEQQRICDHCGKTESKAIPQIEDESAYAAEVIRLVNVERAKYNLSPLTANATLNEYAQLRSTEIVSNFDHKRPDGSNPLKYVMSLNGVHTAGENIAAGQRTPKDVVNGWMNSPGHRANILNTDYTSIGVGCYHDNNSKYGVYWTQIFAG